MKTMIWVVNPTKLCNLRCSYCYQWNDLSNPERTSSDLLRKTFVAIRDYHHQLVREFGRVTTTVQWLGGEPLTLPLDYLRRAMRDQVEIMGELLDAGAVQNVVQTNLYKLTDSLIDFLVENGWKVGVSCDVVPGVRVSVSGRHTEQRVLANVNRLRAAGITPAAITVLANHTVPRIVEIYDALVQHGFAKARFLPLFSGPSERPMEGVVATNGELATALCNLFVHWIESGAKLQVEPLQLYLQNVLRKMVGVKGRLYDRRVDGEAVLIVNPNGDLYQLLDSSEPAMAMGNLDRQSIEEILRSAVTATTLIRDTELRSAMCDPCPYAHYCSGFPAFEASREGNDGGRCAVAHRVHVFIEAYLREAGLSSVELGRLLREVLMARAAVELPGAVENSTTDAAPN